MVTSMVVLTEPFQICIPCNVENLVSSSGTTIKMHSRNICSMGSNSSGSDLPILRSVTISSDIARSQEEVCNFIDVNSSETTDTTDIEELKPDAPAEYTISNVHGANLSVSYILPSEEDSIVSAIVLSKWDDIIGPQTVHVWSQDKANVKIASTEDTPGRNVIKNVCLAKSVKYVTVHTVNCTGLNQALSPCCGSDTVDPGQKNSGIFIVPEIDLVAQFIVFQLQDHQLNVLHSLAILVSYQHYSYFLHLRQLCWHWLQRMAARLHVVLLKVIDRNMSLLDTFACAKPLFQEYSTYNFNRLAPMRAITRA